ncbi:hypothetical protein GCM10022223_65580 [Kineosporia mesophila]|uniref:Putative restriction endonuclease domain-containing protein n=1 Tax=Kineosporia mesophila TaxID=566012 RepID=A0ABP7AQX3_9ACTN|nr:Uma2 family endonuclease [Kineosporia mesophila]MCD5349190.1 Uma2 family endonuclease [Kineosporia mesophila]
MTLAWLDVLKAYEEVDVPQGWRLSHVTVSEMLIYPVLESPYAVMVDELIAHWRHAHLGGAFLLEPELPVSLGRAGIFVPDLCVVHREVVNGRTLRIPLNELLLAVEITNTGSAVASRNRKLRAYAKGGVPQYLLIDAHDPGGPTVTLHTDPAEDGYLDSVRVLFGEPITLRDPLAMTISTANFPVPDPD